MNNATGECHRELISSLSFRCFIPSFVADRWMSARRWRSLFGKVLLTLIRRRRMISLTRFAKCASTIVWVKNSEEHYLLCDDFKAALISNIWIESDLSPTIEEIMGRLEKAKKFAKIDFKGSLLANRIRWTIWKNSLWLIPLKACLFKSITDGHETANWCNFLTMLRTSSKWI